MNNLFPFDRATRISGGLFLVATPILNLPTYPFNLLGFVLIATGAIGYCPVYALAGAVAQAFKGSADKGPHDGSRAGA